MANFDERLTQILKGYANFLREKELALPKHQPYLARWVKGFLLFAREHGGYTFEQTLDLFLAEVGGRVGMKPWQLQQASDAIRIYRYQYRGAKDDGEGGSPVGGLNDEAAILVRLREVIRLRHYAKSTEKTCLHWNRRFLAYRCAGRRNQEDAAGRRRRGHSGEWRSQASSVRASVPGGCSVSPPGSIVPESGTTGAEGMQERLGIRESRLGTPLA